MRKEPTASSNALAHRSTVADKQSHQLELMPTDVEQMLYTASSGDTARLEIALFGASAAEIGLHPDVLAVNKIQDEVIKAVFRLVALAVKEGRRDEVAGSVRYLLNEIGEKIVVVLAQAKQYHKNSLGTLRQGRNWWQFKGKIEKRHETDCAHIGDVIDTISNCRAALMNAIYESFLPELQGVEANELRDFILLRDKLVQLHQLVTPGKSEDDLQMWTRSDAVDTVVSGMLYSQGALHNVISGYMGMIREIRMAVVKADTASLRHKHLRCLFEGLDHQLFILLKEYDSKVEKYLGHVVRAYLDNTGMADSR
ncbi:hypothetical protein HYW82_02775 [Candidatus Peregrinibacteria bacterium]|nr:hypothetical protein [Candidatus Peregrinibacteria bacterium]